MQWKWKWVRALAGAGATIGVITNVSFGGDLNLFKIAMPDKELELPPPIGIYNCDDLENKFYVGHKVHLQTLRSWIKKQVKKPEENTISFNVLVVDGMGGVGKTSLLRRFVKEVSPTYQNVVWIPAQTRESMSATFKDLASSKLQIPLKDGEDRARDERSIVEEVYTKLLKHKTLMVFDNAECHETETDSSKGTVVRDGIADFMPKMVVSPREYPKILISSRNKKWETLTNTALTVGEFSAEECQEYIKTRLKYIADAETKWKELPDYFGNLIIAIESAVDAIIFQFELSKNDVTHYTVDEFLKTLSKFEAAAEYEDAEDEDHVLGKTYGPLWRLWQSTFEMLETKHKHGKSALHVLDTLAFLSPSGVPLKLLNDIYEGSMKQQEKLIAIDTLQKLSLISVSSSSQIIQAHRLLQQARIKLLKKTSALEGRLEEFSKGYKKTLRDITFKNPDSNIYVENAVTVFNHLKHKLEDITANSLVLKIPEVLKDFDAQFVAQAYEVLYTKMSDGGWDRNNSVYQSVCFRLINALIEIQDYYKADKIARNLHAWRVEKLGEEHMDSLNVLHALGRILQFQGNFEAAEKVFEQVLTVESDQLGPDAPRFLTTKHNYAAILYKQKKYEMALKLFKETYELSCEKLGRDHRNTLNALEFVGACLKAKGKYQEALEVYEKVYVLRSEKLGMKHPSTVKIKSYLDEMKETVGDSWRKSR